MSAFESSPRLKAGASALLFGDLVTPFEIACRVVDIAHFFNLMNNNCPLAENIAIDYDYKSDQSTVKVSLSNGHGMEILVYTSETEEMDYQVDVVEISLDTGDISCDKSRDAFVRDGVLDVDNAIGGLLLSSIASSEDN